MKHTVVEQRTVKETKIVKVTCDRCNGDVPQPESHYDVNSITIRREVGKVFPEGVFTNVWKIEDLCDSCIEDFHDLLNSAGYKITYIEGADEDL